MFLFKYWSSPTRALCHPKLKSLLLGLLLVLLNVGAFANPQVKKATYIIKETNLFGTASKYAVLEIEADQDLYSASLANPSCPCVTTCPNITSYMPEIVDNDWNYESLDDFTILPEGVWLETNVTAFAYRRYFKIQVLPDPSNPCPAIVIQFTTKYGRAGLDEISFTLSNSNGGIWVRQPPDFEKGYTSVCPTDAGYSFGDHFLAFIKGPFDNVDYVYSVRWFATPTQECPSSPPSSSPSPSDFILLENRIPHFSPFVATPIEYINIQYFRFQVDKNCSDFSLRRFEYSPDSRDYASSVYISIDPSNPRPTPEKNDFFLGQIGLLSLSNVCYSRSPLIFYISIYQNFYDYELTVTSDPLILDHLISLPTFGMMGILSLHGHSELVCGDQVFKADVGVIPGDSTSSNGNWPMYNVAASNETNPLYPRHQEALKYVSEVEEAYSYDAYLWDTSFTPIIHPRKIVLAIVLEWETPTSFHRFFDGNISNCTINFRNSITNSRGEVLQGSFKFQPKKIVCDFEEFRMLNNQIQDLLKILEDAKDQTHIKGAHWKLNFIRMSDTWTACVQEANKLFDQTPNSSQTVLSQTCNQIRGTDEWWIDPCCGQRGDWVCCGFTEVAKNTSSFKVKSEQSDCLKIALQNFEDSHNTLPVDADLTCSQRMLDQTTLGSVNPTQALDECAQSSAVLKWTRNQTIQCLVDTNPPTISRFFLTRNGFEEEFTPSLLFDVLQTWITDPCEGITDEDPFNWCKGQLQCNWMDCFNLSYAECESQCLDPTLGEFVCMTCDYANDDPPLCAFLDGYDESTCVASCSTNLSVTDMSECFPICSDDCPGCTEQECRALGICSSVETIDATMAITGFNGVCFSYPSRITRACNDGSTPHRNGCIESNISDALDCQNIGGVWRTPRTSSNCQEQHACYDESSYYSLITNISEEECKSCDPPQKQGFYLSWILTIYSIQYPYLTYPDSTLSTLNWTRRSVARIPEKVQNYFNRLQIETLRNEFAAAVDELNTIAALGFSSSLLLSLPFAGYLTHEFCFYGATKQLIETIGCGNNQTCFEEIPQTLFQVIRTCPFSQSNYTSPDLELRISSRTFTSGSTCQNIKITKVSALKFGTHTLPPSSSQIFLPSPRNGIAIVQNSSEGVSIGQLASSGYTVTFSGDVRDPMLLCIAHDRSITLESGYTVWDLGFLDENGTVLPLVYNLERTSNRYCGEITQANTTYFLISRYETEPKRQSGQLYAGATIYLLAFALTAIAAVYIILLSEEFTIRWFISFGFPVFLVLVFSGTRSGFFFALASVTPSRIATYIFFEGPTFIYLSLYILSLAKWATFLVLSSKNFVMNKDRFQLIEYRVHGVYGIVHFIHWSIFFAFLFVVIFPPSLEQAACSPVVRSSLGNIYLAYLSVLAGCALSLALAFIFSAIWMVYRLHTLDQLPHSFFMAFCALLFTVCFLTKSALFLWTGISDSRFPALIFVFLEVVPVCTILYAQTAQEYQHSQTTSGSIKEQA